jgi:hypothetical protein
MHALDKRLVTEEAPCLWYLDFSAETRDEVLPNDAVACWVLA